MLARDFDAACSKLTALANNHPWLRPYQIEANAAVEQAIADRKRLMLVAMDTATGKTFTLVNQTYPLMKSGVGRRILFLVGRRALAAQAVNAFVYVCTIQRMAINLFGRQTAFDLGDDEPDDDADRISIPIHAFDLIVADECHRGYTAAELSVWRNTLDRLDAVNVGLMATPAAHTKA